MTDKDFKQAQKLLAAIDSDLANYLSCVHRYSPEYIESVHAAVVEVCKLLDVTLVTDKPQAAY